MTPRAALIRFVAFALLALAFASVYSRRVRDVAAIALVSGTVAAAAPMVIRKR